MMLFIICTKERLGIETQGIRRFLLSSLRFLNIYLIYIYLYIVSVQSRFVK